MSENIITDYNKDKKEYNKLKELIKKRNKIHEKQVHDLGDFTQIFRRKLKNVVDDFKVKQVLNDNKKNNYKNKSFSPRKTTFDL
jgi:hypothetical protein